jgi:UDP-N-acetylmuramoyl-tripeptide--D-alanyl-D-alanine ligase
VGKTTTKEMIAAVLSQKYKTLATQGNLNNEIGLPKMCFRLDSSYEAAVFEMGMSGFGEISRLTDTARPTIGIITNIGVCHIEMLGSREGILKAKMEILEGMDDSAPLIINGDNDLLPSGVAGIPNPVVVCGIDCENADCRAENIIQTENGMNFVISYKGGKYPVKLPAVGIHNVCNACVAFACGMLMDIAPEQAVKGLAEYVPTGMRQKIVKKGGITVIEDCYNASPDSIKASLQVLSDYKCKRRIAVLGDMKELGDYSLTAHTVCGETAADKHVDILLAYGPESEGYINGACGRIPCALHFNDKEELAAKLCEMLREGDAVLVKGSRAMKLEDVITKIYESVT